MRGHNIQFLCMHVHVILKSVFCENYCQHSLIVQIFEQKKYKLRAIMSKQNVSKYLEKQFFFYIILT